VVYGVSLNEAISIEVPLAPDGARRAREALQPFRSSLDEMSYVDVRLLVSELVVEALGAQRDPRGMTVELQAEIRGDRVHVEVAEDGVAYRLPSRRPLPGDPGWALCLVQALAKRWGVRRSPGRATVWLEVPCSWAT
jgi:Histidine kinase-like ATPase domain